MPVDLTPEAIDALIERLREDHNSIWQPYMDQAADTIAALRAAPVAMRERAAQDMRVMAEDVAVKTLDMLISQADKTVAQALENALNLVSEAILALPLDAPAPVDPVAEAARDAMFYGTGIMQGGSRVDPSDFFAPSPPTLAAALSDGVDALTHALYLLPDDCNQRLGMEGALRRMTAPETLAERLAKCVRPLEWRKIEETGHYRAVGILGVEGIDPVSPDAFEVIEGIDVVSDLYGVWGLSSYYPTLEAAKAAAQADYTARILAALDMDAIARLLAEAVEMEREWCAAFVAGHARAARSAIVRLSDRPDPPMTLGAWAAIDKRNQELALDADRFDVIAAAIRARADRQTDKEG